MAKSIRRMSVTSPKNYKALKAGWKASEPAWQAARTSSSPGGTRYTDKEAKQVHRIERKAVRQVVKKQVSHARPNASASTKKRVVKRRTKFIMRPRGDTA